MAKGANFRIYETEATIVNILNNCGLQPIILKYMVGNIYNSLDKITNNAVQKESEEYQKELEQEKKQSEDEKEQEDGE